MARFRYQGLTDGGRLMRGELEAASVEQARELLAGMRIEVQSVEEAPSPPPRARIGRAELVLFNQQLASIAQAGVPLDRGLREIARDIQKPAVRRLALALADDLQAGVSVEQAFERHRASLPPLYGRIIKAGLQSGRLGEMLVSLNRHLEVQGRTRRIVIEAVTYPAVVLALAAVLLTVIFSTVIPSFREIFVGMNAQLPVLTLFLLELARNVVPFWLTVGAVIGGTVLAWMALSRSAWGRRTEEAVYLRVPILGRLYHRSLLSRLTDTLAMLVGSGCDMPTAVRLAFASTGSQTLLEEGELMAEALERGEDLTTAGVFCRHVPPLLFYSMRSGIQRNELQDNLYGLSDMYALQAQTHQTRLQGILMPIMIILVGGVVALAIVAMFMPMVSLIQNVQRS
jgi:type II secretory pathway component PulF